MIISLLITFLPFCLLYVYFKFVYLPKKMIDKYAKAFTDKGFKVNKYPFKFLGTFMDFRKAGIKQHGDCFYREKHNSHQYDLAIYNQLFYPEIDFINPELQKAFFSYQNFQNYRKIPMSMYNFKRTIGEGLIFSQGTQWKHRRKIMNLVFNYDFLISKIPEITSLFSDGFELMQKKINKQGNEKNKKFFQLQIYDTLSQITGNVIMECFFGIAATPEQVEGKSLAAFISCLISEINMQAFSIVGLLFGAKFLDLGLRAEDKKINNKLGLYRSIIREKVIKRIQKQKKMDEKEKKGKNIIQILFRDDKIDLQNNTCLNATNGEKYGIQEILDEFSIFYLAGMETTSHFILMMIYYVANDQRIQQKLRAQINNIIKCEADITIQNLKKLTYIDWIQYQTTRQYGPINGVFDRQAIVDHFIYGVPIHKGTLLTVQPIGTHYNPKYFKNPFEFRPQRWESQCKNLPPFVLTGFSGGPRSCIGKHLAYLESKIGLVVFMLRYKSFSLPKKQFVMQYRSLPRPETMKITLNKSE